MKEDFLLSISNLSVKYEKKSDLLALQDISLNIKLNSVIGIVGESGSGKSTLLNTIMRLLPSHTDLQGHLYYYGNPIVSYHNYKEWSSLFGRDIVFIPQNPKNALDPTYRIGAQLTEAYRVHSPNKSKLQIRTEILRTLQDVGISNPEVCFRQYPHELSGGMCQRVLLAMILLSNPKLILADEPTTALDATTQIQIIKLLKEFKTHSSIIFVTHDLGLALLLCDEICVMHSGKILEIAPTENIFDNPQHPYTKTLLQSISRAPISCVTRSDITYGCDYFPCCNKSLEICKKTPPSLLEFCPGHSVRCWHSQKIIN